MKHQNISGSWEDFLEVTFLKRNIKISILRGNSSIKFNLLWETSEYKLKIWNISYKVGLIFQYLEP